MYLPHFAHVTCDGRFIHNPLNPQGLVIVSEHNSHMPLLMLGEVGDEDLTNLFITPAEGTVIYPQSDEDFKGEYCVTVKLPTVVK